MEEIKKEITLLKGQIKIIKLFNLALTLILIMVTISFQIQYSSVCSYYQSTTDANQELLRYLENLNSDLQEQNEYIQNILSEKN